jgi:hypothetical protein
MQCWVKRLPFVEQYQIWVPMFGKSRKRERQVRMKNIIGKHKNHISLISYGLDLAAKKTLKKVACCNSWTSQSTLLPDGHDQYHEWNYDGAFESELGIRLWPCLFIDRTPEKSKSHIMFT